MAQQPLERVVRNIDARLTKVEKILPTLATREALRTSIAEAIAPLATRAELAEAIAPLATRAQLAEAIAPLATRAELAEAIAPLATRAELAEAIAPLATKAELREESERTRRHFDVVAERLEGKFEIVAEGLVALRESVDRRFERVDGDVVSLDRRVTKLEAKRRTT
jgi:uncharacterized protein YicC (UPF0701 family)